MIIQTDYDNIIMNISVCLFIVLFIFLSFLFIVYIVSLFRREKTMKIKNKTLSFAIGVFALAFAVPRRTPPREAPAPFLTKNPFRTRIIFKGVPDA